MKNTHELKAGGFYLFESLSSANSIYFRNNEEIGIFKTLIFRYLKNYVEVHKLFVDSTGYQLVVRIKQDRTIKKNYQEECSKKGKFPRLDLINEPWKIISEKMRIFKSTFVKAVNKLRGREGVLVKHKYKKYYFENELEYNQYILAMESGKEIESQRNKEFSKARKDTKGLNWLKLRALKWLEKYDIVSFGENVGREIITLTLSHHNPRHQPHTQL